MKYFEIKEVDVKETEIGFVIDGNRFAENIEGFIPTKGINEKQLITIVSIAMENVENGEFVDSKTSTESKCGSECSCKKDNVVSKEGIVIITPEIKIEDSKKPKPSKKKEVIKPVVNDTLSRFQNKHKIIY